MVNFAVMWLQNEFHSHCNNNPFTTDGVTKISLQSVLTQTTTRTWSWVPTCVWWLQTNRTWQTMNTPIDHGKLWTRQTNEHSDRSWQLWTRQTMNTLIDHGKLWTRQTMNTPIDHGKLWTRQTMNTPIDHCKLWTRQTMNTPIDHGKLWTRQTMNTLIDHGKLWTRQTMNTPTATVNTQSGVYDRQRDQAGVESMHLYQYFCLSITRRYDIFLGWTDCIGNYLSLVHCTRYICLSTNQ